MTPEKATEPQPAEFDFPNTFFEDAIEALENAETRPRLREIEIKAHFMAALAERVCDTALHAEAQKIARLVREKMTILPSNDGVIGAAPRVIDLLPTAAEIHRRR
jgi:hypothetical protein